MTAATRCWKSAACLLSLLWKQCSCYINGWESRVLSRNKKWFSLISSMGCNLQNVPNSIMPEHFWGTKENKDNTIYMETLLFSSLLRINHSRRKMAAKRWDTGKRPRLSVEYCPARWVMGQRMKSGPQAYRFPPGNCDSSSHSRNV